MNPRILKRTNPFDSDEEDAPKSAHLRLASHAAQAQPPAEEEDPLDAFMSALAAPAAASQPPPVRTDLDEPDPVEAYIAAMARRGVDIGTTAQPAHSEDVDSDEEVYATARAIDAAAASAAKSNKSRDADDDDDDDPKRSVEPLKQIDHDSVKYIEIEKDFYEKHVEILGLSVERVQEIRKELGVTVAGIAVPHPCLSFAHFGFDQRLVDVISSLGFGEPTGIQRQAVPVALSGRDLIAIAKTGSGKTASYVWPMLTHMLSQPPLTTSGPIGLILAPTRELASQIHNECKRYGKAFGIRVAACCGGEDKHSQFKRLRGGNEVVVATPGRLIDMVRMKALTLERVSFLVLDEADRMLDLGFEESVLSLCGAVRPDRQTVLTSATFPRKIEALAARVLTDPVRVCVGAVGAVNEDVEQVVVVLENDLLKWEWLIGKLAGFSIEGSVLVFVGKKQGAQELADNLRRNGFDTTASLHGDMQQAERDKVLRDFRKDKVRVLVCTDVAARGLDIKSVMTVVNFDVARDIDAHVHRVGRTGRAGVKGFAYTLVTLKDDRFASDLVRNFEMAGTRVPEELMRVAMKNAWFMKSRARFGRGGGRRGRGGGGRGSCLLYKSQRPRDILTTRMPT
ncbi:hypothetical protein HK096_004721 [Nowakowskiella sp. JEL0078]|nr:hypothetical protein HK096_004721 [Nowakowskiella sp. JEL0078]